MKDKSFNGRLIAQNLANHNHFGDRGYLPKPRKTSLTNILSPRPSIHNTTLVSDGQEFVLYELSVTLAQALLK
jgi:hypothetical protein